jgi:uncharacterized protein (TIGR02145 family)
MKKVIIPFLVVLFTIGSSGAQDFGTMTDPRDGKTYKTIRIGKQIWMAENMNHRLPNSWCYNNADKHCDEFGRLYNYLGATQACPPGWVLPRADQWDSLIRFLGTEGAALKLKEGGSTGFNALYGGLRYDYGGFNHLGEYAWFWSRVFSDDQPAWVYGIGRSMLDVSRIHSFSGTGFSVRCIRR